MHGDAVEAGRPEAALLAYLAHRRVLRSLAGLDPPMDCFPGPGTARIPRSLKHQHFPAVGERANHEDIDDARLDRGHVVSLPRAPAAEHRVGAREHVPGIMVL